MLWIKLTPTINWPQREKVWVQTDHKAVESSQQPIPTLNIYNPISESVTKQSDSEMEIEIG
nr:hypothetical protein Iba_chr11cCG10000 [Ipomoea batatas]